MTRGLACLRLSTASWSAGLEHADGVVVMAPCGLFSAYACAWGRLSHGSSFAGDSQRQTRARVALAISQDMT
jgi:hypothetical protein